ncbi:MAG: hypothetical protein JSV08_05455 [Acidobacteriota bacterium]|nr:MAG: hypothetical protein JSV08_05455 [Acidobacteriota bacterium]
MRDDVLHENQRKRDRRKQQGKAEQESAAEFFLPCAGFERWQFPDSIQGDGKEGKKNHQPDYASESHERAREPINNCSEVGQQVPVRDHAQHELFARERETGQFRVRYSPYHGRRDVNQGVLESEMPRVSGKHQSHARRVAAHEPQKLPLGPWNADEYGEKPEKGLGI